MLIRIRRTSTHPAADWTSANPWLEPLEMGIEEEAPNKAKLNVSDVRVRWNSLDYWSPGGSGVQIVTTTVQTNVGTKQALLAAVPTGKVRIVDKIFARGKTGEPVLTGTIYFGFGVAADDWATPTASTFDSLIGTSAGVRLLGTNESSFLVGTAGDVFGIIMTNSGDPATIDIDVHYYDVDA